MGSTTTRGYPYPVGTDRVMDGDDAIKALAEKVDAQLAATASGSATLTPPAADTAIGVAITFPVGRFTAAPTIVCQWGTSIGNNASQYQINWPSSITASGFTLQVRRWSAVATTVHWFASSADK